MFTPMENNQWRSYLIGELAERKYALLPVSELIPAQRAPSANPDDGQRTFDNVRIKGVSVRMTMSHAEGVRLLLFAFRNGNRRDLLPSTHTRPFQIVEDDNKVARQLYYETLTKARLNGVVDISEGQSSVRHLGLHEGPFAVRRGNDGVFDWKSSDGTAFMSRFSRDECRPIGQISMKMDEGKSKVVGCTVNLNMSSNSLMRTFDTPGQAIGSSWTSSRHRQFEFYISLDQNERFQTSSGSLPVSERPLEIFLGFDAPEPFEINCSPEASSCGMISAMDMEVYYE